MGHGFNSHRWPGYIGAEIGQLTSIAVLLSMSIGTLSLWKWHKTSLIHLYIHSSQVLAFLTNQTRNEWKILWTVKLLLCLLWYGGISFGQGAWAIFIGVAVYILQMMRWNKSIKGAILRKKPIYFNKHIRCRENEQNNQIYIWPFFIRINGKRNETPWA